MSKKLKAQNPNTDEAKEALAKKRQEALEKQIEELSANIIQKTDLINRIQKKQSALNTENIDIH